MEQGLIQIRGIAGKENPSDILMKILSMNTVDEETRDRIEAMTDKDWEGYERYIDEWLQELGAGQNPSRPRICKHVEKHTRVREKLLDRNVYILGCSGK